MAWSLAGIAIVPGDEGEGGSVEPFIARQAVLDQIGETLSWYGAASVQRELRFMLFDTGSDLTALINATQANADVNLTGDFGSIGDVRIMAFRWKRRQDIVQTTPVYACSADLIMV